MVGKSADFEFDAREGNYLCDTLDHSYAVFDGEILLRDVLAVSPKSGRALIYENSPASNRFYNYTSTLGTLTVIEFTKIEGWFHPLSKVTLVQWLARLDLESQITIHTAIKSQRWSVSDYLTRK